MNLLDCMPHDAAGMGGKACIRGDASHGWDDGWSDRSRQTIAQLLAEYPYLPREDLLQALVMPFGPRKIAKSFYPAHEASGR